MKKADTEKKCMVVLPEGCFSGNCLECAFADKSDWDGDRVYCCCSKGWTKGYNYPKNRDNCTWFEKRY